MRRALYLLEIFGNPLLEGDQPVLDPEFLMDIMEFNEEVDEVISKEDITDLRDKIRTELERLHDELKEEFSQQNTGSAKIVVAKMQYYHNLRYKVKDKELELGMFHWAKIEGITIKRTLSVLLNSKRYYSNATQIFKEEILEM